MARHHIYDLTADEWVRRYYDVGRWTDPLRGCEIVETRRITGGKVRVARLAEKRRDDSEFRFVWILDRYMFDEEGFTSLELAQAAADVFLWDRFARMEGLRD